MRSFVCIYYGRTGSSWLMNSLASVPRVLVTAFEPLESWAWDAPDDVKLAWAGAALSPPDPTDADALGQWTAALEASPQFEALTQRHFDVVGFKMSLGAIGDHDRLLDTLDGAGCRLVFLERRNRIKHALSLYRAHEQSRDQFTYEGEQPPTRLRMRTFDRWLQHSEEVHAASAEFRERCRGRVGDRRLISVAYEDFADDAGKPAVISRVSRFLGLDPAKVQPSAYRKVTPDTLAAAVVNYRALRRRYAGGPYEQYFDD